MIGTSELAMLGGVSWVCMCKYGKIEILIHRDRVVWTCMIGT